MRTWKSLNYKIWHILQNFPFIQPTTFGIVKEYFCLAPDSEF